jgi:hypothetical protein
MKEFFARLNPTERRFVVGVGVLFFIVINFVWVWPHFWDWGKTRTRMTEAQKQLSLFEGGTNQIPDLRKEIDKYQKAGEVVPAQDQAVRFVRLIQNEESKVGVMHDSMTPQRPTGPAANPFFLEQSETMSLQSSEKQLVDFLYNLGNGTSLIRVKVLSVQPDQSHQKLSTRLTLIASYQKNEVAPRAPAPAPAAAAAKTPAPAPTITAKPTAPAATPAKTPVNPSKSAVTNLPGVPSGAVPKPLTPIKK